MTAWLLPLLLATAAPDAGAVAPGSGEGQTASSEIAQGPSADSLEARHTDWLVVPFFKYDPDARFGYGGAGQIQGSGGVEPYRYQLTLQFLFTTGGVQSHYLRYEAPHFLGSDVRLMARFAYYHQKFANYYGDGNATTNDVSEYPGVSGRYAFQYDLQEPIGRVGAQVPLGGDFHAYVLTQARHVMIRPYDGSLLEAQQPRGVGGGRELMLSVGLQHDTRDNEAVPTQGHLAEISLRGQDASLGSSFTYGGINAKWLQFATLMPRLIGAFRLEGDLESHGTPFYALPTFGGFDEIDGLGGEYSLRGLPQDRYVGQLKALGTAELRARLATFQALGGPLNFGAVTFLDLGRVWSPGEKEGPPGLAVHPGYGAGLRLWRRAFVLRADAASSPERPLGLYLVFGHFF